MCRVRWARPTLVWLLRPRPPSRNPVAAVLRLHPPEAAQPCRARQVAAHDRSGVPLAPSSLSVRSSFCVVAALAIADAEAPSSCPPLPRGMIQPKLPFVHDAVRPRLCAHLPLVYRSVRTHDLPQGTVSSLARPSHKRSIACAALLSFAGENRRAQNIEWPSKCTAHAARRSAGLHSHAPTLKPDGGR